MVQQVESRDRKTTKHLSLRDATLQARVQLVTTFIKSTAENPDLVSERILKLIHEAKTPDEVSLLMRDSNLTFEKKK